MGVCVITLEVHVYLCINSFSVYILSVNALNEKVMIGLQTTGQHVGKRHIAKVGQQPGILGLMSPWTNSLPKQLWQLIQCLVKENVQKKVRKVRKR